MVMKALRDGAKGGITKFILFGFLGLATGGLVMMDVGGFFRGGVGSTDVARVGKETLSIQSFDRNLRLTISRLGMSPQEAYRLGYTKQILAGDVRAMLLNQGAKDLGILVPDDLVAKHIKTLVQPMVTVENSAKDVLFQILRSQGITEAEFANTIARDMENNILAEALEKSFTTPSENMLIDLYKGKNETRDIEYVTFLEKDLKNDTAPTDEDLQNLYTATRESYATPEMRVLKIVVVDTSALKKSISISDEEIKQTYESNIDFYTKQATWTLDQALVPTKEQADKIYTAAKNTSLEKAVQKATGNKAAHLGEKSFQESTLLDEIKDAVLTNETKGKLLEPVKSTLGWYIIKVTDISPKRVRPLSEVKAEIKDELLEEQIIDQQYELANTVDDMLAGGASLEEVKETVDLKVTSLAPVNQYGINKDGKDGLKNFPTERDILIESGFSLQEGETSPIFETADGNFMAINLDSVTPKTYATFEEVKDTITKRWVADQKRMNNQARVRAAFEAIKNGEKSLSDFGKVTRKSKISRNSTLSKPLSQGAIAPIFNANLNQHIIIGVEGGGAIARVTDYKWPKVDTSSKEFEAFKAETVNEQKNEALQIYLTAKQAKYKAEINQKLLDQVYGTSQEN